MMIILMIGLVDTALFLIRSSILVFERDGWIPEAFLILELRELVFIVKLLYITIMIK